jgi:hypothetical protein
MDGNREALEIAMACRSRDGGWFASSTSSSPSMADPHVGTTSSRASLEAELRALTDAWLRIYNGERPHDSLGRVPPLTFLPKPSSAEKNLLLNCPLHGGAYDTNSRLPLP